MKLSASMLKQSIDAFRAKDTLLLRKVASEALDEAAITQTREFILMSIVDYSLSKIMSKLHYQDIEKGFYKKIDKLFEKAKAADEPEMIAALEEIEKIIVKLDEVEGHYENNIIEKAKSRQAAKLYEKGLSLKLSAKLTGAEESDVLDYIGKSRIHDVAESSVKQRFGFAKEILK